MKIDLTGKVALVTGASGGIGRAISGALLEAGAIVARHGWTREADFRADLSSDGGCKLLFEEVIGTYGTIDILVNNAGCCLHSPLEMPFSKWVTSWERTLRVNLTSAGILTALALRHFKKSGGGRIIFVASRAAFRGDTGDLLAYAASKGGMVSLAKSVARAFGKDNIKSFVIAPGPTETPMADQDVKNYGEEAVFGDIALNERTKPEHIAPTVLMLASGLMDHATGCTIDLNGGSYVH